MISIDGQLFDPAIEYFSFDLYHRIGDMEELVKFREFTHLKAASFNDTGLNDVGLRYVSSVPTIEGLNLQNTRITDEGLAVLERLPNLRHLRLKENEQLTSGCVPHLLKLVRLTDLQIHETSIDQHGLDQLAVLNTLTDICLDVSGINFSFDGLLGLSRRMPWCAILAKGRGEFWQGEFRGTWDDHRGPHLDSRGKLAPGRGLP